MLANSQAWTVAKVGGSLFELSDLRLRLLDWIDRQGDPVVLVPGGGQKADRVRRFEQLHCLTADGAHWLAVRAMSRNARFLVGLLGSRTTLLSHWPTHLNCETVPVLDPYPMLLSDEGMPGSLPHSWDVTSDSIAARIAVLNSAGRLALLKSTSLPEGMAWDEASRRGLVDRNFPRALEPGLEVDWIDLRGGSVSSQALA